VKTGKKEGGSSNPIPSEKKREGREVNFARPSTGGGKETEGLREKGSGPMLIRRKEGKRRRRKDVTDFLLAFRREGESRCPKRKKGSQWSQLFLSIEEKK